MRATGPELIQRNPSPPTTWRNDTQCPSVLHGLHHNDVSRTHGQLTRPSMAHSLPNPETHRRKRCYWNDMLRGIGASHGDARSIVTNLDHIHNVTDMQPRPGLVPRRPLQRPDCLCNSRRYRRLRRWILHTHLVCRHQLGLPACDLAGRLNYRWLRHFAVRLSAALAALPTFGPTLPTALAAAVSAALARAMVVTFRSTATLAALPTLATVAAACSDAGRPAVAVAAAAVAQNAGAKRSADCRIALAERAPTGCCRRRTTVAHRPTVA
mmetsp:Transcript_86444/g.231592  ORF Transcript_86444/g.231592 Transcript_86444/m.231592 type:complete len:268 (+) Transcript_86444:1262-2065(+)